MKRTHCHCVTHRPPIRCIMCLPGTSPGQRKINKNLKRAFTSPGSPAGCQFPRAGNPERLDRRSSNLRIGICGAFFVLGCLFSVTPKKGSPLSAGASFPSNHCLNGEGTPESDQHVPNTQPNPDRWMNRRPVVSMVRYKFAEDPSSLYPPVH